MRRGTLLVFLFALPAAADDWPGWRGPNRDGVSAEKRFPTRWSATENVRWKAAVPGLGVSAPIVCGDRVFLTSSGGKAGEELYLLGYDRADGRELWRRRMFGSELSDGQYAPGAMAVPTPTTDGKRVFALYGTGDLVCVDTDGRPVWIRSLAGEYGAFRNRWGMASSPLLIDGLLVVQVDHWTGSYLLGVDAATGKNRWKTPRGVGVNWTSPVVAGAGKDKVIVAVGTNTVKGYDPATGQELWALPGQLPQSIPTPVVRGDRMWVQSGQGFTSLCLRLGADGKAAPSKEWTAPSKGAEIPSPLVLGDYYYYAEDSGFVACLRADTGEPVWRRRLPAKVHASPVAAGDTLYLTTMSGAVTVLRAGPEYKLLARNELGEALVASPALANGCIFLRGEKHLYCIGGK
ncbi:MAG: PQQ-binding-like beta-propeller repeat protein [Gemmataceae bacterium]